MLNVMGRKRHREGRGGSTFCIEGVKYPILKKNSGETKFHDFAPCIEQFNACIGFVILGLSSLQVTGQCCWTDRCPSVLSLCMSNAVPRYSSSSSSSSNISSSSSSSSSSSVLLSFKSYESSKISAFFY